MGDADWCRTRTLAETAHGCCLKAKGLTCISPPRGCICSNGIVKGRLLICVGGTSLSVANRHVESADEEQSSTPLVLFNVPKPGPLLPAVEDASSSPLVLSTPASTSPLLNAPPTFSWSFSSSSATPLPSPAPAFPFFERSSSSSAIVQSFPSAHSRSCRISLSFPATSSR